MKSSAKTAQTGVRYLEIDQNRAGQRLDNFLLRQLKGVPKSRVYRLLRRGEVRVNRGRAGPDYRVQEGDSVRLPPVRTAAPTTAVTADYGWLSARILHEDEHLLVIDKPAGFAVHGGSEVAVGVIEAFRTLRPDANFLELVHRLDRGTSGCLLLAKSRPALLALHRMWRDGGVHKHYLALIKGRWRGGARMVNVPLARDRPRGAERLVGVTTEGKNAESRFTPKRTHGPATLVDIELLTGRTHQARVHAAHLGHPIAGDDKYGDYAFNRSLRPLGLPRWA